MKIARLWTKAAVVLGALLIQTLCVYLGQALAAEPSPPLLVTIGVNPYEHQAVVSNSGTCPAQQDRYFPASEIL